MTEERITETRTPDGNTHTHTTVVTDEGRKGTPGWVWLIVLVILAIAAFFVITQMSDAEVAKDTAVAGAANEVGDAAGQVGDAAQDVADEVTGEE